MPATTTASTTDQDPASDGTTTSDYLFVVLDAGALASSPSRHALDGIEEVHVGRGQRAAHRRDGRLTLYLPDARISGRHLRLSRDGQAWWIEDLRSKNGTYVDGGRVARSLLGDGALVEIGHTFLRFRRGLPAVGAVDLDAAALAGRAPGLASLVPALESRFATLEALARRGTPLAIVGETGTGKDLAARAYHRLSGRHGRLVTVRCAALPAGLGEQALLGDARDEHASPGVVRAADGGTLFLDEVADLPVTAQAALLRVLDAREVHPVDAAGPVSVDVRVVSATHRDLPELVRRGRFRADLWARLSAHVLVLPPLRERLEDLGWLVHQAVRATGAGGSALHREAARKLLRHRFPLNTRELFQAVGRALLMSSGGVILPEHLSLSTIEWTDPDLGDEPAAVGRLPPARAHAAHRPWPLGTPQPPPPVHELERLLSRHGGNVSEVARALGRARPLVHRWIKRFGLQVERYRPK